MKTYMWIILIIAIALAVFMYAPKPAQATPEFDIGVQTGEGLSAADGTFSTVKSTVEVVGDPQPPFNLLPWMIEDYLMLDSEGISKFHSIETFFQLGQWTDSYTFSAIHYDDDVSSKTFDGFGVNWILPIIWTESSEDEDGITVTKHKTVKVGIYSNGDSDYLAKLDGKYPVYRGENYMANFKMIYDNEKVEVIYAYIDHPTEPGGTLHLQGGYWYNMWGGQIVYEF